MSRYALSMSDRTELWARLGLVGRVLKLQAIVIWSLRLLIAGLVVDCVWLAGSRFLPYGVRPTFLLIAPAALAAAGGVIAGFWHVPAPKVARRADRALGRKERLVTAVELHQGRPGGSASAALAGSLASDAATRDLGTSLARGDLRQAAREMKRLGEEAASMSPADRLKLARSLREAGNRTSRSNSELAQALRQSADALESGDSGQASGAMSDASSQLDSSASRLRAGPQRERALAQLHQSRSAINRSQQAGQSRSNSGQRGQSQQAGARSGEGYDDSGASGGEEDPGSGDRPGGSGAGTGQGDHDESVYDPLTSVGHPDVVPGQQPFDPNEAFENPDPDSPSANEAQVGYKQVYAQYEEKATQTLQNSYIPAGLKDIVKDYFSSLAPNK